jgi:carbonic anhydrase
VGENVSLVHGSLIHGPAYFGNNTFVGMESMVFNAKVGNNVAIGVASTVTGGVEIADDKFVPPGAVITTQEQADNLPDRIGSEYENINEGVLHVNKELADGYSELGLNRS